MNRRSFLKGMVATAAGLMIPQDVLAEPERRVFPLDRTMVSGAPIRMADLEREMNDLWEAIGPDQFNYPQLLIYDYVKVDDEIMWHVGDGHYVRAAAGTRMTSHKTGSKIEVLTQSWEEVDITWNNG